MKKALLKFLILPTALSFVFFVPLVSFSQTDTSGGRYTVLAPLPGTTIEDSGNCVGNKCTTDIQHYLPNLFKFGIGIAAVMAFVMITFGGITYMTTDSVFKKDTGRKYINNAVIGLILVIAAWVILYTVNPEILQFKLTVTPPPVNTRPDSVTSGTKIAGILQGYPMTEEMINQDSFVRGQLKGIRVNSGPCKTGGTVGCTNVYLLPLNAIIGLTSLKSDCSCDITITGGTEGGHAAHGPNKPVVDLSLNDSLNKYLGVQGAQPISGTVVSTAGATYTYENTGDNGRATGPHWHVVFK